MGAAAVIDSSLSDLSARLDLGRRRLPIDGMIELTFRCNIGCAHCYVKQPAGSATEHAAELSTERLKRLLDEIAAEGGLFLTLTGGEPLLRPDFPDLYLHALRAGLLVSIFTNGTMITERMADLFDEHRPEAVEITLYGHTQQTYDRVSGVPGSFDRCRAGLERLLSRGINVRLKAVVLAWNAHEILEMEAFAQGLGLPFRFDGNLNPRVDCGPSRYRELQVSPQGLIQIDRRSKGRIDDLREFLETSPRSAPVQPETHLYTCGAGFTGFTVDAHGRLLMCPLSRQGTFDLRERTFHEGWHQYLARLRGRTWQTDSPCRTCSLVSMCGSCPAANEMETGDPEKPIASFCEITHRRAVTAMGEASGHRADASCCLPALAALPSRRGRA